MEYPTFVYLPWMTSKKEKKSPMIMEVKTAHGEHKYVAQNTVNTMSQVSQHFSRMRNMWN